MREATTIVDANGALVVAQKHLTPSHVGHGLEYERKGMPSYESSMRNLAKARAKWRPPLPWRSSQEAQMIRRYAFQWFTCRGSRPSGRAWARSLGVSHTWLQKLVREFTADPNEMWRLQKAKGDPRFTGLNRAREYSRQIGERGELRGGLRLSRQAKFAKFMGVARVP
jgi:hypothetical protein